jgi:hypothetical protein
MHSTPEPSVFEDRPAEPTKSTPLVCDELLAGGAIKVFEGFNEDICKLKTEDDITATLVHRFLHDHQDIVGLMEEYAWTIFDAVDKDSDFIYEFGARTRKITIEFFLNKAQAKAKEALVEKLNGMTIVR